MDNSTGTKGFCRFTGIKLQIIVDFYRDIPRASKFSNCMDIYELSLMKSMTDQQKTIFMSEYNRAKKSTTVAVLLALFLGGFGAHRFYLNKIISGVIYILFFWTFIPAIIALIECFLMSGTIKKYNEGKAIEISQKVKIGFPSENS